MSCASVNSDKKKITSRQDDGDRADLKKKRVKRGDGLNDHERERSGFWAISAGHLVGRGPTLV